MKTILEKSTLKGVFAGFIVCCLFGVITFADWSSIKFFDTWGSDKMDNKLSAQSWDEVLQRLDTMEQSLQDAVADSALTIPSGAIVGFVDRTTCPDGWVRYNYADGKVLMGTSDTSLIGHTTGSNSVTLTINNIPAHRHAFYDYLTQVHYSSEINNVSLSANKKINGEPVEIGGHERDVNPTRRAQTNDSSYSKVPYVKHLTAAGGPMHSSSEYKELKQVPDAVNITPAHVKVLYCKKL